MTLFIAEYVTVTILARFLMAEVLHFCDICINFQKN